MNGQKMIGGELKALSDQSKASSCRLRACGQSSFRRLHPVQKRAASGEQLSLWDDIRTAPREHMHLSFQLNRKKIFWDCHSLKVAVDSYNYSHPHEEQIEMVFDFTMDLAEHEAAGEYKAA